MILAVGPGFLMTVLIAVVGRRDVATRLCAQLPHRMMDDPYAILSSPGKTVNFLLGRVQSQSDYQQFACTVVKQLDWGFTEAVRSLRYLGLYPLLASFALGLVIFVVTTWVIGSFSGVSINVLRRELRPHIVWPVLALVAIVPLFMTGCDWTRWWVLITFDVAVVHILFAIGRPEINQVPSTRTFRLFLGVVLALAIPIGHTAHVGGPSFQGATKAAAHLPRPFQSGAER